MAMHQLHLLIILATCATLAYSASFEVKEMERELRYEVKEMGGELFINCTTKDIPDTNLSHWVLTDLTVLKKDQSNEAFNIMSHDRQLHIAKLEQNTIGEYFCVLTKTDKNSGNETLHYFRTSVFEWNKSTWDAFRTQTIVGVVAAGITLVVMIGLCMVWRYRWRPEKQDIVAVNGGYDTADGHRYSEQIPEKTRYAPENDTGFVNESFTKSAPQERHSVIVDDTKF